MVAIPPRGAAPVSGAFTGRRRTVGGVALLLVAVAALASVLLGGSSAPRRRPAPRPPRPAATATASVTTSTVTTATPAGTPAPVTLPPPRPAAPAQPAPAVEALGANVNLLFDGQGPAPTVIAAQLGALHATGATEARSDAFWEASEPAPPTAAGHQYTWAFDDTIAAALARADLRWLPVLDYSAPWATSIPGQDHSPPRSPADYAAYAEAFAARYGSGGEFWSEHPGLPRLPVSTYEIWNEPDNATFWTPRPDAAAYAQLYAAARAAIQTTDPAARVIIGGLTHLPQFLPAVLAADPGLRGHIDGVGIHPYGPPPTALQRVREARAVLDRLGLGGVPLYATEFGWTTQIPGSLDYVAAADRPGYVLRTMAGLARRRCGLAAALLYTWWSPQQAPGDAQQWYGISSRSGAPTPDTQAFAAAIRVRGGQGSSAVC